MEKMLEEMQNAGATIYVFVYPSRSFSNADCCVEINMKNEGDEVKLTERATSITFALEAIYLRWKALVKVAPQFAAPVREYNPPSSDEVPL